MPETIQSRRIQMDFDIDSGRLNLSTKTELRRGDILKDENELEVVAVVASLSNDTSLPAHILALRREVGKRIGVGTYVFNQENGRGYLLQSSRQSLLISNPCYDLYDEILTEAGQ